MYQNTSGSPAEKHASCAHSIVEGAAGAGRRPAGQPVSFCRRDAAAGIGGLDVNERWELSELSRHAPTGERNEKARALYGVGSILNLGGSIDFTIWTPPKSASPLRGSFRRTGRRKERGGGGGAGNEEEGTGEGKKQGGSARGSGRGRG
ncbi:hypothetical protein ALC56_10915 [Trachymyrmex septentrionalis]|uniref:Uncharacterized protein n=1 Tax=Trachymyrmex septentrionalis TaxID=34720 RepID=A0A195F451_9HYME|nr:hypothetical protein ALC56_10915 [Trachymyrmex septentrionalis]